MNPFALIRAILMIPVFILVTVICSTLMVLLSPFTNNPLAINFAPYFWAKSALFLFGVKLVEINRENIPNTGCLFLFNHTSFFDIFALFSAQPKIRFGSKIELFKVPFLGAAMRRAGILPIARNNRDEVMKIYKDAQERVAKGEQFALSPEGTRNTVEKLKAFKSGPFIFAINAKAPIVPVIIRGAHEAMSNKQLLPNARHWRSTISVEFLKPIDTSKYTIETRKELSQLVFERMNKFFQ